MSCYPTQMVVVAPWFLYQARHFVCNLSFVTPFEVRFKVLGRWRVILRHSNALEVICIYEDGN